MPYINPSDFGVMADGVTDDTASWGLVVAEWKATGKEIVMPKGGTKVSSTILFDRDGSEKYRQGPRIVSPYGPFASYFIGCGLDGVPLLKIDGRNPNDPAVTHFSHTRIEGVGFRQDGLCVNSDAIEYHSTWHSRFEDIHIQGASGCGFFAFNQPAGSGVSIGDSTASAHVQFNNVRVEDCKGPAWSCDGSRGGITNHTFNQFYSLNNALTHGAAQVDIDGALHISFNMCAIAALNNINRPLVKVRGTNLYPDTVVFQGGEFGNASGDHFDVDKVIGMCVRDIRQIRRPGETAARYGFILRNSGGNIIRNLTVSGTILAVNNAGPSAPFTWMRKTGGALETSPLIYSPSIANSPGVVVYEGF